MTESSPATTATDNTPAQSSSAQAASAPSNPGSQTTAEPQGLFDAADKAVETASKEARPEWLHERYANAEEQAKGYAELQKKFLEKTGAPEKYDFSKVMETHKAKLDDSNPNFAALQDELKANGFNQTQAAWLMDRYFKEADAIRGEAAKQIAASTPPNLDAERKALSAAWGAKTGDNLKQVAAWANANLEPDVVRLLNQSAKGTQFIHALMSGEKGPVPLRDNHASASSDVAELEAQRELTIKNPAYSKNDAVGRQLQAKALQISERLIRLRGGELVRPA